MISIDYVEFRNFLGYGDYVTKLSFSDYKGIALITGEFDDHDTPGDERRCGAGKTSIIEAIVYCLFGSLTYIEKPGDKVVNWNTGKNCYVKIRTIDGYEIIRTRKMSGNNELIILKDGEDVTKSTSIPSQEFINNTFKIDYRTFVVSVVFGQLSEGFLSVTDSKRRAIFERFIKITSFNSIAATAKEFINKLETSISGFDSKIDVLKQSKESIDVEIISLLNKVKEFDLSKEKQINDIKNYLNNNKINSELKIDKVKSEIDVLNEKAKKFIMVDVDDVKFEWKRYDELKLENDKRLANKNELIQLKSKFEIKLSGVVAELKGYNDKLVYIKIVDEKELEEQFNNYNKSISQIKDFKTKKELLVKNINNIEFRIGKLESETNTSNISKVKLLQVCDKCFNEIDGNRIEKVINEKKLELDSIKLELIELKSAKSKIDNFIVKLESVDEPELSVETLKSNIKLRDDILSKINDINTLKIKLEASIKDCNNQIDNIEFANIIKPSTTIDEAVNQKNDYDNIKKDIIIKESDIINIKNSFKDEIISAQDKINKIRLSDNPYTALIFDKKSKLDDLVIKITSEIDECNKSKKIRQHVEYIKDSYYNKKKMRAFWISEIIPALNKFIKYYFDAFEINNSIEFDEFLNYKTDKWDFSTHSGGEKQEIDLSIMFALNDMHSNVFGQQSNFMVLDEVDGRVDPFIINRLTSLLNDDIVKRDNGLTNIFIISHKESMKDRFPHKIKVKNKGGNAYIVK